MSGYAGAASTTVIASLKMSVAGRLIEKQIEVPAGSANPRQLLPVLQWFTNEVVGAACDQVAHQGKSISCRAGCGACCRQLVPISPSEARHIADLIEGLPEPRRNAIRRRFQDAAEQLAAAGLLQRLLDAVVGTEDSSTRSLGMDYFHLGIACPFLEDESCSIHPHRPLACREYLVTSPAENCRKPSAETIETVKLPAKVSSALRALDLNGAAGLLPWVPLILAPQWAASHPEDEPQRTGPQLMSELFQRLSGQELPTGDAQRTETLAESEGDRPPKDQVAVTRSQAESQAQAYDEVPYESRAFAFTHPDSMAAIATLFGMTPPAVERCRVLEIGCAEGGNLIPMAFGLPAAKFVGLDLSPRQVAEGRRRIEQLALANIDLRVMDLMDVDGTFGEFDYIICHGVFSWVPRAVQEKILAICSENLAPQGVAYVSYNVYPGWRMRGMVRDMLLYHVDAAAPARERLWQAREFLKLLAEKCASPESVYASVIKEELAHWRKSTEAYLRHDPLGDVNEPLYFHEFAARLSENGLQYLSDAKPSDSVAIGAEKVRHSLSAFRDDVVLYEQHLDFLCERAFRRSLLCHDFVRVDRNPQPAALDPLLLSAAAVPVAKETGENRAAPRQFRTQDGITFSISDPWLKAAFVALANEAPRSMRFDELCRQARREIHDCPEARRDPLGDVAVLKQPLIECAVTGLVALHVHRWPHIIEVTDRPHASPVARLEAQRGQIVTNLRHCQVELDEFQRQLLPRLDGRHTQAELLQVMTSLVESRELAFNPHAAADSEAVFLSTKISETLKRFAAMALLHG